MRTVIIGIGNQGQKRLDVCKDDIVAKIDINFPKNWNGYLDYKDIKDVPLDIYDAAIVCTPIKDKPNIVTYLLSKGKHVLVEKPLIYGYESQFKDWKYFCNQNGVTLYTAYNHRFEPNIVKLKRLLDMKKFGKIYSCSMFYGNGTVQNVRQSYWQDSGTGVIENLMVHLIDLVVYLFNEKPNFKLMQARCFETKYFDHAIMGCNDTILYQLESTYISWKNSFTISIIGEKGSVHISGLSKWGNSFILERERVYPSGSPLEDLNMTDGSDKTWALEWQFFKYLCENKKTNIENDIYINSIIQGVL